MARLHIIWDHGKLTAWRKKRHSAKLLAEAAIEDAEGLLAFLKAHEGKLRISHLVIYLDHASLDHHVERLPPLAKKMQRQLMVQRKEKIYGQVPRSWVTHSMGLTEKGTHSFHFVASLPEGLSEPIARWALKSGIVLEGIYSLPHALALLEAEPNESGQAQVIYRAINISGYLLAYDAQGRFLFVNRVARADVDALVLEAASKRLALFTEQEFGETPDLKLKGIELEADAEKDASLVGRLLQTGPLQKLNLIAPKQRNRQRRRAIRHRAFAASILFLGLSFLFMLPKVERKREVQLRTEAMQTEIQSESLVTKKIENDIVNNRALLHVIDFSRERIGMSSEDVVPMPLAVAVGGISHSLPSVVELDMLDCTLDVEGPIIKVEMRGRPLSADVDLVETLESFEESLEKRGWRYTDWQLAFVRERNRESRFERRGSLRSFTLSFNLLPFEK
ncbi:MAG: Uncharacterised protein [Opitutia bacterium UBA7350]|nr:MAG: Uncharacterised protein [Opitutae bacterium UBA7350]